MSVSYELT